VLRTRQERMERAPGRHPRGHPPDCTVESYSLAVQALRNHRGPGYIRALDTLLATRNPDAGWPPFSGDDARGCWRRRWRVLALATGRRVLIGAWNPMATGCQGPRGELVLAVEVSKRGQ